MDGKMTTTMTTGDLISLMMMSDSQGRRSKFVEGLAELEDLMFMTENLNEPVAVKVCMF